MGCAHDAGVIRVTVADDGVGLPADGAASGGIGHHVMAYRARAIGAELVLANEPTGGAKVTCAVRCRGTSGCADHAHAS